jgi:hypothetical protein
LVSQIFKPAKELGVHIHGVQAIERIKHSKTIGKPFKITRADD